MIDIKTYKESYNHANVYRISSEDGDILVDPAIDIEYVEDIERIKYILVTHAHYDHIRTIEDWGKIPSIKCIYAHSLSKEVFLDPFENCSSLFMDYRTFNVDYKEVKDGDIIDLMKNLRIRIYHLPGHSRDSVAFLFQEKIENEYKNCFFVSGDLIFADSIGRSDLPGSSPQDLRNSLRRFVKLYESENIDKNLNIYPGHSIKTNLDDELKSNVFLSKEFLY